MTTKCYLSIFNYTPYYVDGDKGDFNVTDIEWFHSPTKENLNEDFGGGFSSYSVKTTPDARPYMAYGSDRSQIDVSVTLRDPFSMSGSKYGFSFKFWQDGDKHGIWINSSSQNLKFLTNGNGFSPYNDGRLFSLCVFDQTWFRLTSQIRAAAPSNDEFVLAYPTLTLNAITVLQTPIAIRHGLADNPPLPSGIYDQWRLSSFSNAPYQTYPTFYIQSAYASGVCLQNVNGSLSYGPPPITPNPSMDWIFCNPSPPTSKLQPGMFGGVVGIGQPQSNSNAYNYLSAIAVPPSAPTTVTPCMSPTPFAWQIYPISNTGYR